jgi:DNA replication protein DnaD
MLWNWKKMNFTTIDDIKKNKLTFSHLRTWKKNYY